MGQKYVKTDPFDLNDGRNFGFDDRFFFMGMGGIYPEFFEY